MKNAIKKTAAAVFCAALLMSTAACSDTSWSVKNDDETLSVGTYIYYMSQAYGEAKEKSEKKGNEVLSATIEKKNGDEWIRDRAKELCVEQLTVNKLCRDNKVTPTENEIDEAYNDTSAFYGYSSYAQMWIYSKQSYENMGISEDSYKNAAVGTVLAKSNLFTKMYDKNGTQEVSDKDIEKYFTENYISYQYLYSALSTTDDEGNTNQLSDEEKEKIKIRYENYVKMINDEGKTISDVSEKFKKDTNDESETDPVNSAVEKNDGISLGEDAQKKLKELDEGKAAYVATDTAYYFVYKLPIKDKVSTLTDKNDATRSQVLHALKDDDFTKYIEEQSKKLSYEQNDAAFSKYTPSRVIPDSDNSEEESSTESKTESSDTESSTESKTENSNTESSTESKTESSNTESSTESKTESSNTESSTESKTESSNTESSTESKTESSNTESSTESKTESSNTESSAG